KRPAVWLVGLILVATIAFLFLNIQASSDPPYLILSLNIIFVGIPLLVLSGMAASSFARTGVWPSIWIGAGSLAYGLAVILSGLLQTFSSINATITTDNILTLLGSAMFLLGSFFVDNRVPPKDKNNNLWLTVAQVYIPIVFFMIYVTAISVAGVLPPFFVQGAGGTPLRELVLATATALFFVSGVTNFREYYKSRSEMQFWYSLALLLSALGFISLLLAVKTGTPLNWTGRIAAVIGGLYFLVTALVVMREAKQTQVSTGEAMAGLLSQTEAKLNESEERFYKAFHGSPIPMTMSLIPEGRWVDVNDRYTQLVGYSRDELIGHYSAELNIVDIAERERLFRIVREKAKLNGVETNIQTKTGKRLIVLYYTETIVLNGKQHSIVSLVDITERKQSEEELRRSEERFRSVLESSRDVIARYNLRNSQYEYVSPSVEALVGYLPAEFANIDNQTAMAMVYSDDLPVLQAALARSLESGEAEAEYRERHKNGNWVWVSNHMSVSKDSSGKPLYRSSNIRDITERKKTEAEIAYRATFTELNPNPVVELDANGNVVYMNPSANALFPDLPKLTVMHPYLTGWYTIAVGIGSEKTGYRTRDIKVGDRWYEQAISPVPTNQNLCIYGKDITVRKKVDELKDEFIGMVSHELKTPLTVIIGALATATDLRIDSEQARVLLGDAVNHAGILANLVDNLLELSRQQSDRLVLNTTSLNVADIVQSVVKVLQSKSDIHHLVSDVSQTLAPAQADPLRVERIFYNLVDNAIKYSPNGGEVRITGRQEGELLIFGVRDQGPGISSDDQARLFQSFERLGATVKGAIQGTGLGLRVCRILLEAHGGRIRVESEKGKGSTFFFTLPVSKTKTD
ncbi:MAG: PAS domain S-box protein, partial [Dehalococcoidales bacterium]|nr:PAS domain S-box protein [Dehalococcoidales bacterium]